MEKSIEKFFDERKSTWLKGKIKASMSEEEKAELECKCDQKFDLENWLPDAAKRAGQLSMVTHPAKFAHPGAKASPIISKVLRNADGFLRTGNSPGTVDVFGNAAALDVYKFLSLDMNDGNTLLHHIEKESETVKKLFSVNSASFDEIRSGFLAIKQNNEKVFTSGKIKQVYFPVEEGYHLLSVLTPSGLMFELRNRINDLRFSDQTKEARDMRQKGEESETGFDDVYNLSMIGHGGTKPQNISVLNSQNGGKAYLLPSMPPVLKKRRVSLPKYNFFENSLWVGHFRESFQGLNRLLVAAPRNMNIRTGRDNIIRFIIDQVIDRMWQVRQQDEGWSRSDNYANLPAHQKIWLDNINIDERESSEDWINKVISEFSRWIVRAYEKSMGKQAILIDDDFILHIKGLIEESVEALR